MRFLQAGNQKLVALEPEHEIVEDLVSQAGFKCKLEEDDRQLVLEIKAASAASTIRLFEAGDPANREWFAGCQFYVDAFSGAVLQTPLTVANCHNAQGRLVPKLRVAISKELPASFRLPGRQTVSEQVVYALLYNFLVALKESGVAICGKGGIQPLAGGQAAVVSK
jgi:hypothetical protein